MADHDLSRYRIMASHVLTLIRNFYGARSKDWSGSKPRISRVVSKSDSDHGTATTATEPLG